MLPVLPNPLNVCLYPHPHPPTTKPCLETTLHPDDFRRRKREEISDQILVEQEEKVRIQNDLHIMRGNFDIILDQLSISHVSQLHTPPTHHTHACAPYNML